MKRQLSFLLLIDHFNSKRTKSASCCVPLHIFVRIHIKSRNCFPMVESLLFFSKQFSAVFIDQEFFTGLHGKRQQTWIVLSFRRFGFIFLKNVQVHLVSINQVVDIDLRNQNNVKCFSWYFSWIVTFVMLWKPRSNISFTSLWTKSLPCLS